MQMPRESDEYARPAQPPDTASLNVVREAAVDCTACHLYERATQTVFGQGPKHAPMMLVGEQPGDYEDVAGKPFVGPAGKIMDRALEDAGIDRTQVYVTNAVKHFKWEPRGKRRIHQKPNSREIAACRPWLEAELRIVRPRLVVAMGATAAQAIFGPGFRVSGNGEKYCRPSLRQEFSRLFILRLFFGNPTRNLANANTSILCRILALHCEQLAKNKRMVRTALPSGRFSASFVRSPLAFCIL
jgi:DNA polymerase